MRVKRGKFYKFKTKKMNFEVYAKVLFIYKKQCVYEHINHPYNNEGKLSVAPIWSFQRSYERVPDLKAKLLIKEE